MDKSLKKSIGASGRRYAWFILEMGNLDILGVQC